jgi:bile acid:Na+ symporter, BASS family
MFLMDWFSRTLLFVFLFTSMFSIGMQTSPGDIRSILASKGVLVRLLGLNFIIVPFLFILFARILPLTPEVATAFVLLGCAPGGISAVQFTSKMKDSLPLAAGSAFILSFLAMFISPLMVQVFLPGDIHVAIPYGRVLLFVMSFLLIPLLIGMLLYHVKPLVAKALTKPFALIGTIAFITMVVLLMGMRKQAMNAIGTEAVLFMLLLIVLSMVAGWFVGGPDRESRHIFATAGSMRNAALCLLIALESFPDPRNYVPVIAFSALMIPPNLLFTAVFLIRKKITAKKSKNDEK